VVVLPVCVDGDDTYNKMQSAPVLQKSGDHWMLNGLVRFVPFVNLESLLLISAIDEQGRCALVSLSAKAMGVLLTRRSRLDDSLVSDIEFQNVEFQTQDILAWDDAAIQLIDDMKTILRVGISAQLLGLSHAALQMTLEHLRIRKQFGKPLASFQALQHQCVNGYLDIELNRSLLYRTSMAWDKHQSHPAMMSALKARTSRSALAITRSAVQLHGAMGYTHEHNIGLYYKQAVVWSAEQGNDVYHAQRFSALTLNSEPLA
jgi:alkylation response protein AidB-like acyl-CoA dehydrogenase